ncbi:MAG TPA: phosphopantetheine adenylyltransferase [Candidatus Bathyarchaeia archaeon]|nr:phosphopantetheine adenylyltransferase [Candidatus Bathyarchaeia archaeon]
MKVAIGGTFDPLHDGHKKLLRTVFELSEGGEIVIGVTSDTMAHASRSREVLPYSARTENIRRYMFKEYGVNVRTVELNDRYGVTLDEDFDYIVISPETYNVALKINELRKERGKKLIKIVKVEHMKAANGKIISSTRIKAGEIDEHGSLL